MSSAVQFWKIIFKGFCHYGYGGPLGHVTRTFKTKFLSPIPYLEAPHDFSLRSTQRFLRCFKSVNDRRQRMDQRRTTVMIISFRTNMPRQTVQSQIRLLIRVYTAIPSASFGLITLWYSHVVQILEWLQQIFWVSEYLGNLQYICWIPRPRITKL